MIFSQIAIKVTITDHCHWYWEGKPGLPSWLPHTPQSKFRKLINELQKGSRKCVLCHYGVVSLRREPLGMVIAFSKYTKQRPWYFSKVSHVSNNSIFNFTTMIRFLEPSSICMPQKKRSFSVKGKRQFLRLEIMCFVRADVTEIWSESMLNWIWNVLWYIMHNMIWCLEMAGNSESCEKWVTFLGRCILIYFLINKQVLSPLRVFHYH